MSKSKLDDLWFRFMMGETISPVEVQAAVEVDPPGVDDFVRRVVSGESTMSKFDADNLLDNTEARRIQAERTAREERNRHVAIYLLPEHKLLDALRGLFVLEGLPADVEFGGVHYDWDWRAFSVRVISESFPAVPDGAVIPRIPKQQYENITHTTIKDLDGNERHFNLTERQKVEATPNGIRFREFL